jgi:TldD protein
MDRRDFLALSSFFAGTALTPSIFGKAIAAEQLQDGIDIAVKKRLADAALGAATAAGASYCDVRVGRYLRQFVITRDRNVENIVNTESSGTGVRVIADGSWGFAATGTMTEDAVAEAARQATAMAKANARINAQPVKLAPTPGVGEVSWRTPIQKNAMQVPVADKVDLLMGVNDAALGAGILRLDRRVLYRSGRPSHLGALHRHRDRHQHRQVPLARGALGTDGPRL